MGTAGGMKGSKRRWILRTKKIDSTAAMCYTYMEYGTHRLRDIPMDPGFYWSKSFTENDIL